MESATDIKADVNTTYRCVSETQVHMGSVTVTLRDAAIQAYLSSSNFSRAGEDHCGEGALLPERGFKQGPGQSRWTLCLRHGVDGVGRQSPHRGLAPPQSRSGRRAQGATQEDCVLLLGNEGAGLSGGLGAQRSAESTLGTAQPAVCCC